MLAQVPYTFSASSGSFTQLTGASPFTWTATIANDDEYSSALNIFAGGENFNYCGTNFTQFSVSTNGFIKLGTGLTNALNGDNLAGLTRSIIAPLWDSLSVGTTATDVTYKIDGTSPNQVLTVEWKNVKWNKSASAANAEFQVELYEGTNVIKFNYGNMDTLNLAPFRSASIGLADNTAITSAGSATDKFLSINVAGWDGYLGTAVYHQSRCVTYDGIRIPMPDNTVFTFTPVTPSAIAGGTYTVGGSSPTYNTLSDAASALNINGVAGPVVLDVRAGTYDDIFHLVAVSGTSSTNTITLKNESGAVTLTPTYGMRISSTGGGFGDAILRFEGTQYVIIDGLTLINNTQASSTFKYEMAIGLGNSQLNGLMVSGGRFNLFRNLTINMKATDGIINAGTMGIRYFTSSSTETDTSKGTSWNTIENCNITGFWRAAWKTFGILGTNPDRGNVIRGCTLGNYTISTGVGSDVRVIEMDCQNSSVIENNIIENIDVSIMTTNNVYGMWFNPAGSATNINSGTHIIRNNIIRNLENSGTSTTTGFAGGIFSNNVLANTEFQVYGNKIYDLYTNGSGICRAFGILLNLSTGTACTAKVYNNMISDLRAPRAVFGGATVANIRGIDLQNGGGNGIFYVYFNTVSLDNSVPPTSSLVRATCLYWANFSTATLDLRNNILSNTMQVAGGAGGKSVCLYPTANSNYLRLAPTTNYNLYYWLPGDSSGVSFDASTLRKNITEHQIAVASGGLGGPRDVNTVSDMVSFTSNNDLHLTGSSLVNGNLACLPIAAYTTDIDGETRNASFPYKGADEITSGTFTPKLNITGLVLGFTNPATGKMIKADTVTVELRAATSPYTSIEQTDVLLNDLGYGTASFSSAVNGTPYYVVFKHINSLETASDTSGKSFTAYSMNYDFTTDSGKAYGDNLKKVGNRWCVINGDCNQDGFIDGSDYLEIVNNWEAGDPRMPGDNSGDDFIDGTDYLPIVNNWEVSAIAPWISKKPSRR